MNDSSLEPLDDALADLLRSERSADSLGGAGKERLATRLSNAQVALAATGVVGGLGAAAALGAVGGKAGGWLAGTASKVGMAALLLGVGGVVGAAVHSRFDAHALARTKLSAEAPPLLASAPPTLPVVPPVESAAPALVPAVSAPSVMVHPPPPSIASAASKGEEEQGVEMARSAVARGSYQAALGSLEALHKKFPNGRLLEERELLTVQALAGAGRHAEARARAERFAQRFPASIFLPAVQKITREP